jgi:hypothetical protein
MKTLRTIQGAILLVVAAYLPAALGQSTEELVPRVSHAGLDRLLAAIKPQRDESPWRDIAWLTDVTEARRRAVAQDKPMVIFTAADGSPLGRT